jgi:hypothetical protein
MIELTFFLLDEEAELRRDMAESSAWMHTELARRLSQNQETKRPRHTPVRAFDDLCPSSSVILMTREISQIAKATTVETIATMQKATMIHEEGRTARPSRVLTDERG